MESIRNRIVPYVENIKEHFGFAKTAMSPSEIKCYKHYLDRCQTIAEFGAGGSTVLAARKRKNIVAVESDPNWVNRIRQFQVIKRAERCGRLRFVPVNIGPTKEWGYPNSEQLRRNWPSYSVGAWTHGGKNAELVLIDGRFRVACMAAAALNTKPGTFIVVHDFWNRPRYHEALGFLRAIDRYETLGVFVVSSAVRKTEIERCLWSYAYTPD